MIKFYKLIIILFGFCLQLSHAQSNQYLHFDGVDDFVSLPNASQYLNNSNRITMAGWFYTDALTYGQGMLSLRGGGTGSGEMYFLQLNNGVLECRLKTTTNTLYEVVAPAGSIQAGVWQHIAWVFDQNAVRLYINGTLIGSAVAQGTFVATDRPFTIGKSYFSDLNFNFKGRIDEVSLWNKALTATEIQNMMNNELTGNETNLQAYYKFNQGSPGGNNTSISYVYDISSNPDKQGVLNHFTLNGATSNFNGILQDGFQYINFEAIPNKLTSSDDFELVAYTNSELPVNFEIVSGPATIDGNTVSLLGTGGTVYVRASQEGNDQYDAATPVINSFVVIDPAQETIATTILHPLEGNVYVSDLIPIPISVRASVSYPDLISVDNITVTIDDVEVVLEQKLDNHFTGFWTPASYGSHEITVTSSNNFGAEDTTTHTVNVQQNANTITVHATNNVWVHSGVSSETQENNLPSFIGAFNEIKGKLIITCPQGGCDPWDRVSSVEVQGKDGIWYEIIRYMTPYGVACQSEIDLTDFAPLLMGKSKFRVNLGTQGNGFLYTLQLEYVAGTDPYPYKTIEKVWHNTYQFGDLANLQPVEEYFPQIPEGTQAARLKLVAPGHGWGATNTNNAAEFSNNTHHVWVNNEQTFVHNNWNICNPNPDNCSPQYGTWTYNRAGWCPGSIAQFQDYNMTSYIGQNNLSLKYILDQNYVDYCHPNNPDCVTGVTCSDCNDGFNPHLMIASYFISYSNAPIALSKEEQTTLEQVNYNVYPNPTGGRFYIDLDYNHKIDQVAIYDLTGRLIKKMNVYPHENQLSLDLFNQAKGMYIITLNSGNLTVQSKKIILE